MKVLLLNGSPRPTSCTFTALNEIAAELKNQGVESEIFQTGSPMYACTACGSCKKTDPPRCIYDDTVNELIARLDEFDGIVIGTPVHFAHASSQVTAFCDRLFYTAGKLLEGKPGAAIASARRAGTTAAIDQLNKYFTKFRMPVVSAKYWNMVHGNTPQEVLQDKEGLQTMRSVARNMAWLLKCIAAADAAGIPRPTHETPITTNFIR